jgi:putative colanic acid biosynthesis UDP-glucose lipid carrier transferase
MAITRPSDTQIPYAALLVMRRISAAVVAVLALWSGMWVYGVGLSESYQALSIIVALLALILFPGRSDDNGILASRFWTTSVSIFCRWCLLFAALLLLGYAAKSSAVFSRKLLFTWLVVTPPLLVFVQFAIDAMISRLASSANNSRRAAIAGANELGHRLAAKIQTSPYLGLQVEGFFDDRSEDRLGNGSPLNVLGNLRDLPDYIRRNRIDVIFIALPLRNMQRVTELLDHLHDTTASIYFVPDIFVFDLIQCRTSEIDGIPVVSLCETPFQGTQGVVKKFSDYVIATIVLFLTAPLMAGIALAIKMTSNGSVIFRQRRYGLDGREITVYKFRTMTVSEDGKDVQQASRDDHRITTVGAFLRKYSLDELPQFINVLQGRMSVVGPRPHAIAHNEEYRPLIKGYMIRHKVNPGITGLAQVLGHRGETKTVEAMQKRVEYDLEYLRNWSLSLDLRIIMKTIRIVLNDKMAY